MAQALPVVAVAEVVVEDAVADVVKVAAQVAAVAAEVVASVELPRRLESTITKDAYCQLQSLYNSNLGANAKHGANASTIQAWMRAKWWCCKPFLYWLRLLKWKQMWMLRWGRLLPRWWKWLLKWG